MAQAEAPGAGGGGIAIAGAIRPEDRVAPTRENCQIQRVFNQNQSQSPVVFQAQREASLVPRRKELRKIYRGVRCVAIASTVPGEATVVALVGLFRRRDLEAWPPRPAAPGAGLPLLGLVRGGRDSVAQPLTLAGNEDGRRAS